MSDVLDIAGQTFLFVDSPKHGQFRVRIDSEDAERVGQYEWSAVLKPNGRVYFTTNIKTDGKRSTMRLHRFIMNAPDSVSELRLATHQENNQNRRNMFSSCYSINALNGLDIFTSHIFGDKADSTIIYFVLGTGTGRVKIGRTNDVLPRRLSSLQTGSPVKLSLLGYTTEAMIGRSEQELHKQFKYTCSHNEWFNLDDKLAKFIVDTCNQGASFIDPKDVAELAPYLEKGIAIDNDEQLLQKAEEGVNAYHSAEAQRVVDSIRF